MPCYCILKTNHDCPEMLNSFEDQYEGNPIKLKFDPSKINSDPRQMMFAADINEVKNYRIFFPIPDEEKIVKFNAVVSYFPKEFTKNEKKVVYKLILKMISESKKYFLKNGRITFAELITNKEFLRDIFLTGKIDDEKYVIVKKC